MRRSQIKTASVISLPGEVVYPFYKIGKPISSAICQACCVNNATKLKIVIEELINQICCMILKLEFRF